MTDPEVLEARERVMRSLGGFTSRDVELALNYVGARDRRYLMELTADQQIIVHLVDAVVRKSEALDKAETPDGVLEAVNRNGGLSVLVGTEIAEGRYCCTWGCGTGACETCPCCSALSCVMGTDGVPDDPDLYERWLAVAAEHNPVAGHLLKTRQKVESLATEFDDESKGLRNGSDAQTRLMNRAWRVRQTLVMED